jgi:hypothetical protein
MTRTTAPRGRNPLGRGLLLALLTTTALAGPQALAPAPAAAAIAQGEDCADPTVVSIECETTGGGGGSSTGTIGEEVIEVEGAAPSPCVVQPSLCLPSQVGGTQRLAGDGAGSPRAPRRRGRSARRGELPIPPHVTAADCRDLREGRVIPPLEKREKRQRAELRVLWRKLGAQIRTQQVLEEEEKSLQWDLEGLHRFHPDDAVQVIREDESNLAKVRDDLAILRPETAPYFALEKQIFESAAAAERAAFEKACEALSSSQPPSSRGA